MVNKEELLKERYLLLKDKEDIKCSIQCLYYVPEQSSSFYTLKNSKLYISSIYKIIEDRIKEIDKILNI